MAQKLLASKESLLCVGASVALLALRKAWRNRVRRGTVLEVDLRSGRLVEAIDPLSRVFKQGEVIVLRDLLDCLRVAAADRRIAAVVLLLDVGFVAGAAHLQELHAAVRQFRASGKKAVAFAETFFETPSTPIGTYYLASACDLVYTPPYAGLNLVSHWACSPFIKHALEKLGIDPQLEKRRGYKTMADLFMEERYTAEAKEMMTELVEGAFGSLYADIAAARGLPVAEFARTLAEGPVLPTSAAVSLRLVDGLAHKAELYDTILPRLLNQKALTLLWSHLYFAKKTRPEAKGPVVALITAEGTIHRGQSKTLLQGGPTIGSDTVAAAVRAARSDKAVRAILLRVNSGGGSAVASNTIYTELALAREQGKKVVVSMGNLAASGGYFISLPANRIVASPTTLTGSVGVVYGKLVFRRLWEKLGVTFDATEHAENASMHAAIEPYSAETRSRVAAATDWVYDDFKAKVALWRGFSDEQTEQVAQGRVYTGARALELKMVDELGGLPQAVNAVRQELGLSPTASVTLREYPRRLPLWQLLTTKPSRNSAEPRPFGDPQSLAAAAGFFVSGISLVSQLWTALSGTPLVSPQRLIAAAASPVQLQCPEVQMF